jgi:hypothetical protein
MIMKKILTSIILIVTLYSAQGQLQINEIQITNGSTLLDEDGDYTDWIELYNAGNTTVDLSQYYLSDKLQTPTQWQLPDRELYAGDRFLVHASAKNRRTIVDHYETLVYPWSWYSYLIPQIAPPANWNALDFDATVWGAGNGGIGYGDGDDGTVLDGTTISCFTRTIFNVNYPEDVTELILQIDYDDSFVAYLNGYEFARSNIGTPGITPNYNDFADNGQEIYAYPFMLNHKYSLSGDILSLLLQPGENVLAIEVHNASAFDDDMSCNPFLTLAFSTPYIQTELSPDWMLFTAANAHTSFKLDVGEDLLLADAQGNILESIVLPDMLLNNSYARLGDGGSQWCFSDNPTPWASNIYECATGYEQKPIFQLESGVFTTAQVVGIVSPNPQAEIRYTLDGSIPTESSALYNGPLTIDSTKVVSARCFSEGLLPGRVEKNTYLINEWGIDLPIVSVSTDWYNLFDSLTGIYAYGPPDYGGYPYFGANFWEDWERESYVEYFDSNHVKQAEGSMGIKIHGGWSRGNDQKSFRLQCKDEYGTNSLDFPMIADKPFITSYKGFNLRNGGNDYGGPRFHDGAMQRAFKGTHVDYMALQPVVVFLNGIYWGYMEMREVEDQNFIEDNRGINNNDVTVISLRGDYPNVVVGDANSFLSMLNYVVNNDPTTEEYYNQVSQLINLENYADYIIAETYWCNGDWSNGYINNYKCWHNDAPGGKWHFMLMDMDFGMGFAGNSPYDDYIEAAGNEYFMPDRIFAALIQNIKFRNYFINRYADLINTNLQQDKIVEMVSALVAEVEPAFPRHAEFLGTSMDYFYGVTAQRLDWNSLRVQGARDVIETHFNLDDQVNIDLDVIPAGAGRIHISTIEPDEVEYPWSGVYYKGIPIKITAIANPGFTFDHWAPNGIFPVEVNLDQLSLQFQGNENFTAYFTGTESDTSLVVSEFMYNAGPDNDSGDWIELHNTLGIPLDLSGFYLKDSDYFNRFDFPLNTTIQPNGYLVIAQDLNKFMTEHPDFTGVIGEMGYGFSNNSDAIEIYNSNSELVVQFTYQSQSPWPLNTDGTGRSVEFSGDVAAQLDPSLYFAGCVGGSPGAPYDPNCGLVGVNEDESPQEEINVFPVPAHHELNINLPSDVMKVAQVLSIYDMNGRKVIDKVIKNQLNFRIDVSSMPVGIYNLCIYTSKGIVTRTIIVD